MEKPIDFAAILVWATFITGAIWLLEALWLKQRRVKAHGANAPEPKWVEYPRSFFPVLLFVLVLRSFFFEPFIIPTGSMKPTLLEGDFILVNKYRYGVRLPVLNQKIFEMGHPKRGDVMVFRYPKNPDIPFIKRVIGVPGDRISYVNKHLSVNGERVPQAYLRRDIDKEPRGRQWTVTRYRESLPGNGQYDTFVRAEDGREARNIVVPEGQYFVMGDNRDNSEDSRVWGFVPDDLIMGQAVATWLSWDARSWDIRWKRMFKLID